MEKVSAAKRTIGVSYMRCRTSDDGFDERSVARAVDECVLHVVKTFSCARGGVGVSLQSFRLWH